MGTFKENVYEICKDVANEFPEWSFVSGRFKNNLLKHSELMIDPGFFFDRGFTNLQPSIWIKNKRCAALYAEIFEVQPRQVLFTSLLKFQVIAHTLVHVPEGLRIQCLICADKKPYVAALYLPGAYSQNQITTLEEVAVDVHDLRPVLVAMMRDGISLIDRHYDLSSEENFLRALPAKYTTRHVNSPYDEFDKDKGVMMCVVRILLGDFDYVERYRSDDFKTTFPKRADELGRIAARLPELRRRFAETGQII